MGYCSRSTFTCRCNEKEASVLRITSAFNPSTLLNERDACPDFWVSFQPSGIPLASPFEKSAIATRSSAHTTEALSTRIAAQHLASCFAQCPCPAPNAVGTADRLSAVARSVQLFRFEAIPGHLNSPTVPVIANSHDATPFVDDATRTQKQSTALRPGRVAYNKAANLIQHGGHWLMGRLMVFRGRIV